MMPTEVHEDSPAEVTTEAVAEIAATAATKPIEEWAKLKGTTYPPNLKVGRKDALVVPHWLHDAARVLRGWAAVGQEVTEAEYDEAIKDAGGVTAK